jgi:hypothetical protein
MPELVPYTVTTTHMHNGKEVSTETVKTLSRNGVTLPLFKGQFGKLSKENAGLEFPYPVVDGKDQTAFNNAIAFLSLDYAAAKLTKGIRTIFGNLMVEAWDKETGAVDWESWQETAEAFTEGEEKRDLLQAEKDDLTEKMVKITDSEEFLKEPTKFTDALSQLGNAAAALSEQLKEIQVKIDVKSARRAATKKANAEILAKRQKELQELKAKQAAGDPSVPPAQPLGVTA